MDSIGAAVLLDIDDQHTLSDSRVYLVTFFDTPQTMPLVLLDHQPPQGCTALFSEQTVWHHRAQPPSFPDDLQSPFDEQAIEIDISTHGRESWESIIVLALSEILS